MKKKPRHHFPYKIFVGDLEWPLAPGSKLHKARIRVHRGYTELAWRAGKKIHTHHLGKLATPKRTGPSKRTQAQRDTIDKRAQAHTRKARKA